MKPVDQTVFGMPHGNCFDACVASVFELALEDVPHFNDYGKQWFGEFVKWCRPRGFVPVMLVTDNASAEFYGDALVLVSGPTPRGPHQVVYRNGEMIHDPHPDRGGVEKIDDVIVFVAIDPGFGP